MAKRTHTITCVDLGSSKTCAIVGEVLEGGEINVIGYGLVETKGMHHGVVVDLDHLSESVERAVVIAEEKTGIDFDNIYLSISGAHICGGSGHASVEVANPERGITEDDIDNVVKKARNNFLVPEDMEIVDILPQGFTVDQYDSIRDPVGLVGKQLGVDVYVIYGSKTVIKNIIRAVRKAGLDVDGFFPSQVAAGAGVLNVDEKNLGTILIDLGGGVTSVTVYEGNYIRFTRVIPLGGSILTKDIAYWLKISQREAEDIKKDYGCAIPALVPEEKRFNITEVVSKEVVIKSQRNLARVIEPRIEEILTLVKAELERSAFYRKAGAGIILTGGGAQLKGVSAIAKRVFGGIPIRTGLPTLVDHPPEIKENSIFSTAVGLILCGWEQRTETSLIGQQALNRLIKWMGRTVGGIISFLAIAVSLALTVFYIT
jgi:cell division protein FtsA